MSLFLLRPCPGSTSRKVFIDSRRQYVKLLVQLTSMWVVRANNLIIENVFSFSFLHSFFFCCRCGARFRFHSLFGATTRWIYFLSNGTQRVANFSSFETVISPLRVSKLMIPFFGSVLFSLSPYKHTINSIFPIHQTTRWGKHEMARVQKRKKYLILQLAMPIWMNHRKL